MKNWFKKKNEETEPIQKSSRGVIENVDSYGITLGGESYVARTFELSGLSTTKLWACYWKNPWVRSCVDKIIKEVVRYKLVAKPKAEVEDKDSDELKEKVREVNALLANPNNKIESFSSIRRKYLRDILVYDAGALEIVYTSEKDKEKLQELKANLLKLKEKRDNIKNLTKRKSTQLKLNKLQARIEVIELVVKKLTTSVTTTTRKPIELYDVKGANLKLNIDKFGNFKDNKTAYVLLDNANNKVSNFAVNEISYFVANPVAGSVYGISPLESIYNTVLADDEAAVLNRRRLENDGMISGILSLPGLSVKKLKSTVMFWKAQGRKKGGRLMVTSSKDAKFTSIAESHKEMQFMEYQKWVLIKIMAVYGMQPIVLGVIDPTVGKLNSTEQRKQFKTDAILPLLSLEAHHLTDVLVKQGFGYNDIEIGYVEPTQDVDLELQAKIVEILGKLGLITINEGREMLGLSAKEGGDTFIVPFKLRALQDEIEKSGRKTNLEEIRQRIVEILDDTTSVSEAI